MLKKHSTSLKFLFLFLFSLIGFSVNGQKILSKFNSTESSISLQITAQVNVAGTIINTAEITGVDQDDSDSTKNNGN